VTYSIDIVEDLRDVVELLSSDGGVSGVVDLLYSYLCSLSFFLCSDVTLVGDPARSTNVVITDISNLESDLTWHELEAEYEAEGYDEEKAEREDPQRSSHSQSLLRLIR